MSTRAWGDPPVTGVIRSVAEDFRVCERLGYEPGGDGEHLWLEVEKRGANTEFVASSLGRLAGIRRRDVGFAGLKDRNALTRQWFSLHLAGRDDPDWQAWTLDGVRILAARRGRRKIQRGGLRGNAFRLRVRDIEGDTEALGERLETIRTHGVPNGFGEQRFGGNNIARAHKLFRGELGRTAKARKGFYLSAARSLIFNLVLAERIRQDCWNRLIDGDVVMLDGSHSLFAADAADEDLQRRCDALDLHPTGPLAGTGDSGVRGEVAAIEEVVLAAERELADGLARFRMEARRRALRMRVADLDWSLEGGNELHLAFSLPAGSYATAVLREVVRYTDASQSGNDSSSPGDHA